MTRRTHGQRRADVEQIVDLGEALDLEASEAEPLAEPDVDVVGQWTPSSRVMIKARFFHREWHVSAQNSGSRRLIHWSDGYS